MKRTRLARHRGGWCAALLSPARAEAQLPRDPAERARVIAQIMEANARQLTLFDRQGQEVSVIGPRDLYNQPVLLPGRANAWPSSSPTWTRKPTTCGSSTWPRHRASRSLSARRAEGGKSPAWSPDGNQVAYVALRDGYFGLYRKAGERQRAGGASLQELRADDAHRLVAGRTAT